MPSNKVLTTLIISSGLVVSLWLFQKTPAPLNLQKTEGAVVVSETSPIETKNDEWKKLLTSVTTKTTLGIKPGADNSSAFTETSLTGQVARDTLSQYLLSVRNGKTIDPTEAAKIAESTLSVQKYTDQNGPVYVAQNLHITAKTDIDTLKKYKEAMNASLKTRSLQIKNNPVTAVETAVAKESQVELTKLDSTIQAGKGFVKDFLEIEVPASAVSVHLALLNAVSNTLTDVELMKEILSDPIKGLVGIGQYNRHILEFQIALGNLNAFFGKNIGNY